MRTKLLLMVMLFTYCGSYCQTTNLTIPNLKNEFKVEFKKNISEGIDVHISETDTDTEVIHKLSFKNDDPVTNIISGVYNKIKETTNKYSFKLGKPTEELILEIEVTKDVEVTKENFYDAINSSEANFIKFLKSKTIFNNDVDKTSFAKYTENITDDGVLIFENITTIKLIKTEDGKINYVDSEKNNPAKEITTENDVYKELYTNYKSENSILSVLFTDDEFKAVKTTDYNTKINTKKLEEVYLAAMDKSEFDFVNNYEIKNGGEKVNYMVSIKSNPKQQNFILKFCDDNYKCELTSPISSTIERTTFTSKIAAFLKNIDTNYEMDNIDIATLHDRTKNYNETKVIAEKTKEDKEKIDNLIEQIENAETQYSGILKLNKEIPVYTFLSKREKKKLKKNNELTEKELKEVWYYQKNENVKFIVTDTTTYIRFFNNKVKDVLIKGHLDDNPTKKFRVMNVSHSITLRSFNNSKHFVPISPDDNDANGYYININDLFDYDNADKSWNYSVRNKEYAIEPEKAKKIEQKKLMDYFTGVIFSDALGLNSDKPNSLLQAEARIKVPLWIYNFGKSSFFHSLNADVNVSIYNGLDEKSRLITPENNNTLETISSLTVNNFDYIKYNNFNAGFSINYYNLELKGLSTEWSLAYGIRYYRAGLRYTFEKDGEDISKDYQLNALSHEFSTNIEIRPQLNFGADINLAFNWLNPRGNSDNIPIVLNKDNDNDDKSILRLQLNLYTKLNPDKSNDGIYARLGGFYHLGAKDFFPQVLVGYATNLSSFVNKFKK